MKLHIVSLETGEVVRSITATPENYERKMNGLLRNMNTENYIVDDSEFQPFTPEVEARMLSNILAAFPGKTNTSEAVTR